MADVDFPGFDASLFRFLKSLKRNNNRGWFQANKHRYERDVREPVLGFIRAMAPRLKKVSPFFVASDRRAGGSLIRIYRDTRFSKDKTPYKTNVGIHFRHEMGRDIHAPGFYVHIAPSECFLGVGIWHPDSGTLGQIRQAIVDDPRAWKRARDNKLFCTSFRLEGDSLRSAPRGFPKDHPMIEDLKRKDFIATCPLHDADVLAPEFIDLVESMFRTSRSFVRFLCASLEIPF